jgi:hypothetical protein
VPRGLISEPETKAVLLMGFRPDTHESECWIGSTLFKQQVFEFKSKLFYSLAGDEQPVLRCFLPGILSNQKYSSWPQEFWRSLYWLMGTIVIDEGSKYVKNKTAEA